MTSPDPRAITRIEVRVMDVRPGDIILWDEMWCYVYDRVNGDEEAESFINAGMDPVWVDHDTVDNRDNFLRIAQDQSRANGGGSYDDATVRFRNPNMLVTIQSPGYDDETV